MNEKELIFLSTVRDMCSDNPEMLHHMINAALGGITEQAKLEREMKMKMDHYRQDLLRMDREILNLAEVIRQDVATERGTDRTANWNRELEGNWSVEGKVEDKIFEREYVYDTAHRK